MQSNLAESESLRPLTESERSLARWMLEHSTPEALSFVPQLERAYATTSRCPCGCASFNLRVEGLPEAPPGVKVLADFVFGADDDLKGIFIYHSFGILSAMELVGYGGDAPHVLPDIQDLCSVETYNRRVRNFPKCDSTP